MLPLFPLSSILAWLSTVELVFHTWLLSISPPIFPLRPISDTKKKANVIRTWIIVHTPNVPPHDSHPWALIALDDFILGCSLASSS